MCSQNPRDWIKICEMLLGPVPQDFEFVPKVRNLKRWHFGHGAATTKVEREETVKSLLSNPNASRNVQ